MSRASRSGTESVMKRRARERAVALSRGSTLRPLAGRQLSGRVGRPRLDLEACAVRGRALRRIVRLDLGLGSWHRPDERRQLDPGLDLLSLEQLDRYRGTRATDHCRVRHGSGLQLRVLNEHLMQELVVVRTDDRDERLAGRLERGDDRVIGTGVPDAVDLDARVEDVEHLLAGRREVPAHEGRLDDLDARVLLQSLVEARVAIGVGGDAGNAAHLDDVALATELL